jgi:hypothetical protein
MNASALLAKSREYFEENIKSVSTEDFFLYATTLLLSMNIFTLFLYLYDFSHCVITSDVGSGAKSSILVFVFESILSTRLNIWDFIYLGVHQLYALIYGEFRIPSILYLMYLLTCKISAASRVPEDLIGASIAIQSCIALQFATIILSQKLNDMSNSTEQDDENEVDDIVYSDEYEHDDYTVMEA